MTIERDPDGRRWFARFQVKPERTVKRPSEDTQCPDHPGTRLERMLGRRWFCPERGGALPCGRGLCGRAMLSSEVAGVGVGAAQDDRDGFVPARNPGAPRRPVS